MGDQYCTELLTRREKPVPLLGASVTHMPLLVVTGVPVALLTMLLHCAPVVPLNAGSAPVVSPLPIVIPADEKPPEVREFHTPKVCLYGVSQMPIRISPTPLESPIAEFRPPQLLPVVADASKRPSGQAPISSWNHAAVPPPRSSLPRKPKALPAAQTSPFFNSETGKLGATDEFADEYLFTTMISSSLP